MIKKFAPNKTIRSLPNYKMALRLCSILQKKGFQAFFVGGVVRDFFLKPKYKPKDIDIATSANDDDLQEIFKSKITGAAFGVHRIRQGTYTFEVASFRKEGHYENHRHPDLVTSASHQEDSIRRDFTVNALYYDPIKRRLFDFHQGLFHIQQKRLCCVGNPDKRFAEDALRILRLFRFSADFQLKIDFETKESIKNHLHSLIYLSKERFLLEFQKVHHWQPFFQHLKICLKEFYSFQSKIQAIPWPMKTSFNLLPPLLKLTISLCFSFEEEESWLEYLRSWPAEKIDKKFSLTLIKYLLRKKPSTDFDFFLQLIAFQKIDQKIIKHLFPFLKYFNQYENHHETIDLFLERWDSSTLSIHSQQVSQIIQRTHLPKELIQLSLLVIGYGKCLGISNAKK